MHLRLRGPLVVLAIAVLGLTGAVAARGAVEGSFERTLKVAGPVELDVTTGSGSIKVRNGDAGSVRVHGTIRVSSGWRVTEQEAQEKVRYLEAHPPIEQNGNVVRAGHIEDHELARNVSISYEIVVPVETRLHSQTGSGSQSVEGIRGPVEANTGSGGVTASNLGDEAWLSTGSGSIEINSVKGSLRATTGSGSIRGSGIAGAIVVSTGSGGVELEQTSAGNVEIETGSGSVTVRGVRGGLWVQTGSGSITAQGEPTSGWRLHTGSGGVTLRLPEQAAFDLYARASSGRVHSDHPVTVQGNLSPREMRGKVRGGGVLIEVETSSGSIRIE